VEVALRASIRRLLIAVAVCFVVLSMSAVHAQSPSDEARSYFERGVEASRNNRWREARILFQRSLDLVAKPSTLLNLAITELRLGNGEEALERLNAFQEAASPVEHAAMLDRAKVLQAQAQALIESEQSSASAGKRSLAPERKETDDGLSDEAKLEIGKARDHYARGNDKEALTSFERAYALSKKPSLLYQVGVVADRLRDDARAVQAYEAFAAALPDAPEAAVAQVRSTALRAAMEERAKQRAVAAASSASNSRREDSPLPRHTKLTAPRTLIVAGALLSAATIGVAGWYFERAKTLERCEEASEQIKRCSSLSEEEWRKLTPDQKQADYRKIADTLRDEKQQVLTATISLAVVAVGTTTAGAIWLYKRKHSAASSSAKLRLVPQLVVGERGRSGIGMAGLSLTTSF
jgi:tetratricopeptide (TPR) repeat protein